MSRVELRTLLRILREAGVAEFTDGTVTVKFGAPPAPVAVTVTPIGRLPEPRPAPQPARSEEELAHEHLNDLRRALFPLPQ